MHYFLIILISTTFWGFFVDAKVYFEATKFDDWLVDKSPQLGGETYTSFNLTSGNYLWGPSTDDLTVKYKMFKDIKKSSAAAGAGEKPQNLVLQFALKYRIEHTKDMGPVYMGLTFYDAKMNRRALLYFGLVSGLPVFGCQNAPKSFFFDIYDHINHKSVYEAQPPPGISESDGNFLKDMGAWNTFSLVLANSEEHTYKIYKDDGEIKAGTWLCGEFWFMEDPSSFLIKTEIYSKIEPRTSSVEIDDLFVKSDQN